MHDNAVIRAHLVDSSQLREAFVQPYLVDFVLTKVARIDAIKCGRLMQTHIRVRDRPVSSRSSVSINDNHRRIGVGEERVDERHAHGTSTNHEVVRLKVLCHLFGDLTRVSGFDGAK
jgi:hypothetical protein